MRWLFLVSLLLGMCNRSGSAATISETPHANLWRALQLQLDAQRTAGGIPGATAAFFLCDGSSAAVASGYADAELRVKMRPDDLMLSGSIGKTYVAVVMLQLIAEGRASLDDKLEHFLGGYPWFSRLPNAHAVTLRHLLGHVSGIEDHADLERFAADIRRAPGRERTPTEIVDYVLDRAPLGRVGTIYQYSDTNYILIGMVIETITGSSYYAELERRLLKPLHLDHTRPSNRAVLPGLVNGYMDPRNVLGLPAEVTHNGRDVLNPQVEWTGGGLISNSRDIARWARLLYGGDVLAPESLRLMLQTTFPIDADADYGLGVYEWRTDAGITFGHQGDFPGYWSVMEYFPKQRLAIGMQFNSDDPQRVGVKPRYMAEALAKTVAQEVPQCAAGSP